jgi:hypothetical protein
MDDWRELMRAGRFAEAESLMLAETEKETGYGDEIVTRAAFYESWGDAVRTNTAEAQKHYREAQHGFAIFASWATSGGEGTARMLDVNRVLKKLSELDGK